MNKSEIAAKWRKKHPSFPTLKLARIIMSSKDKLNFKDVENARSVLRDIEGKQGKLHKDKVKSKYREFIKDDPRPYNPYKLPESFQDERKPFILPASCNNILFISDLHVPYHDINAISMAIDYGIEQKINTVYINGDLIDNANVSKFERDWSKRSVKQEFDATKQILISIRKAFPRANIYWAKGNHCVRWKNF